MEPNACLMGRGEDEDGTVQVKLLVQSPVQKKKRWQLRPSIWIT